MAELKAEIRFCKAKAVLLLDVWLQLRVPEINQCYRSGLTALKFN